MKRKASSLGFGQYHAWRWRIGRAVAILPLVFGALAILAVSASASKQPVDYMGGLEEGTLGGEFTQAASVAVNNSGAGGVPAGTIYATDGGVFGDVTSRGNRIERFQRDDNGTPGDARDDTYHFISAWGAGVESGGTDYEICTVAANCRAGRGIGGNGTLAGDGSLSKPGGISVDQDTGEVYVADANERSTDDNNFRINVYSATGAFLRSFGWDVVESGPDDNGTSYEICKAGLDVCKSALPGSGAGQIGANEVHASGGDIAVSQPDGNPTTGSVFFTDSKNQRVNTYSLDGTSPSSFGSSAAFTFGGPSRIAVDSRGIVYADNTDPSTFASDIVRYDTQNVNGGGIGFLTPLGAPVNEIQRLTIDATEGQFRLTFKGDTTADLPFNASAAEIASALGALPSIGSSNVKVHNEGEPRTQFITFVGALALTDVPQIVASNGTTPLDGGATVATRVSGHTGPLLGSATRSLAVDPDGDGPGPETDVLYAARLLGEQIIIQQFGPVNPPGLAAAPVDDDEVHGTSGVLSSISDLAVEPSTGRIYAAASKAKGSEVTGGGPGVYVLDNPESPPTATLDSLSNITSHSVDVNFTVDPNGPPITTYHLDYSLDGTHWKSTPEVTVGTQETAQSLTATVDPPVAGLEPNTEYHVRVIAGRILTEPIVTSDLTFTTLGASPLVETTGSPARTANTARLEGRVDPAKSDSTYHFEYGDQGPCDTNPCTATSPQPVGAGNVFKLVSQQIEGLQPDTTYHYRLVADNGKAGSPSFGADETVVTRASDAPLSHGHFPGPPGSDRAYEQVSIPDSAGNPADLVRAISDNGERVLYSIHGGNPLANTGSAFNQLFAERTPSGWQSKNIYPEREELVGPSWFGPWANGSLSAIYTVNNNFGLGDVALFRLSPEAPPVKLFQTSSNRYPAFGASDDGSRVVVSLEGFEGSEGGLFDISGATPQKVNVPPTGSPAACGTVGFPYGFAENEILRTPHWISANGDLVFFASPNCSPGSSLQLFVRDIKAGETKRVSPPPLSGPSCMAALIHTTPDAAFFWTSSRLAADDTAPATCDKVSDGDVYRYGLDDGSLKCVTCVAVVAADVELLSGEPHGSIAVAEDGSRVYFSSPNVLLPGAAPGIYRVDTASGDLAYVGSNGQVGDLSTLGQAISPDGSVLIFASSDPWLNPIDGPQNGGTRQYYRYDDHDRSLVCVSCPTDGSAPSARVVIPGFTGETGPNLTSLSSDGETFAFSTPNPLLAADQNTPTPGPGYLAGTDIYEWRDGRLLLVSDGLTNWPVHVEVGVGEAVEAPKVEAVSQSGDDIYFNAPAQYTPDALDAYERLYDARIDGGFEFSPPVTPCPLEVCQGTPKGAPEDEPPGTSNFRGAGNSPGEKTHSSCPRDRRKRTSRCAKEHHRHRTHHSKRHHKRTHRRAYANRGGRR